MLKKKMTPQKERKGQSTFRKKILQAYNYSCAITQENQKRGFRSSAYTNLS